jgi:putative heme-binding domain-containing protein
MPVTDLEFLRDGSMVFTVGGRGTAAALYRVSYVGKLDASFAEQGKARGETAKAPSPTLSEDRAKDSALPTDAFGLGVGQIFKRLTRRLVFENAEPLQMNRRVGSELKRDLFHYSGAAKNWDRSALENRDRDLRIIEKRLRKDGTYTPELAQKEFAQSEDGTFRKVRDAAEQLADGISVADQNNFDALVQILTDGDFRIFSRGLLTAALSLARVGEPAHQETVLNVSKKLADLKTRPSTNQPVKLPDDLKLLQLRVLELSFARQGRPSEERVKVVMEELLAHYPIPANAATPARNPAAGAPVDAPAWRLNRELCALLNWLSNPELGALNAELVARSRGALAPSSDNAGAVAPRLLGPVPNPGADVFPGRKPAPFQTELGRQVIEKTLALMDAAPSQEEQVWYALCLRWAHGWTPEQRVRYFRWFHEKAARYTGGNSFAKFVEAIRADTASRVPESERAALADWLRPVASPAPAAALKPRAFVKAWTLPELEAALDKLKDRQPDLARGKELYTQAQCAQCHLFRDAGGNVGPDLTAVAQRFGRHDILESITDPSKVVSEQYAMVTLTVLDGKGGTAEVSGLVKEETSATITLLTDPLAGKTSNLYKNVIVKREKAAVSTMPPGLLFTLTAEEVADLLALFGAK